VLHARKGKQINLKVVLSPELSVLCKGYETARSRQTAFPFTRNLSVDVIAMAGDRLWKELIGDAKVMKVTSVQLAFTGLETAESGQQSIKDFFKTPDRGQLQSPNNGESSLKRVREEEDMLPQMTALEEVTSTDAPSLSFTCPRCGKRLRIADPSAGNDVEDDRVEALTTLRMEHDDFHFAQDLAKTSDGPRQGVKKKRKEPEGIAKFFSKK
jgi:DNA polymerase eta